MNFEIEVIVRGPERTVESTYGPRVERDQYCRFEVPVNASSAWEILKFALDAATSDEVFFAGGAA